MNTELKKTEKLVSALYLVTSFFADLEPMKWRLRELGSKILADHTNKSTIQEVVSLLAVAKNAGLVSDMNHGIINKEFLNLLNVGQSIPELLNKINEEPVLPAGQFIEKPQERKFEYLPTVSHKSEQTVKDKITRDTNDHDTGAVALKKNGRQTAILSLLKKKGEIMIKDVSPLINGVSEKTIQRELLSMVKNGLLKKEGEKRWSKYSLAN